MSCVFCVDTRVCVGAPGTYSTRSVPALVSAAISCSWLSSSGASYLRVWLSFSQRGIVEFTSAVWQWIIVEKPCFGKDCLTNSLCLPSLEIGSGVCFMGVEPQFGIGVWRLLCPVFGSTPYLTPERTIQPVMVLEPRSWDIATSELSGTPWKDVTTHHQGIECTAPGGKGAKSHVANTTILTIIDRFSKAAHFVALPGLPTALGTAKQLTQHLFWLHGVPQDIVSDRGPQFTSQLWKEFCSELGAQVSLSSVYLLKHP